MVQLVRIMNYGSISFPISILSYNFISFVDEYFFDSNVPIDVFSFIYKYFKVIRIINSLFHTLAVIIKNYPDIILTFKN